MWFGVASFLHVYTSAGKVAPAPASAPQFPVKQHWCITEQRRQRKQCQSKMVYVVCLEMLPVCQ